MHLAGKALVELAGQPAFSREKVSRQQSRYMYLLQRASSHLSPEAHASNCTSIDFDWYD